MSGKAIQATAQTLNDWHGASLRALRAEIATDILAALAVENIAVVELPEPDEIDDDGQMWFGDYEIRVDTTGTGEYPRLYVEGDAVNPTVIRRHAAALLAAANAAEETQ